jgi:hypothetical protein
MNPERADELANTSRALLAAIAESQQYVAEGDFGPLLTESLRRAVHLLDVLKDALGAEGANVGITGELLATIQGKLDAIADAMAAERGGPAA